MENGIIIYQSKYGSTKKYVNWLIEETQFDYIETPHAKIKDIEKYNRITLKIEKSRICMFEYIDKIVLENTFIGIFQHDFFLQ